MAKIGNTLRYSNYVIENFVGDGLDLTFVLSERTPAESTLIFIDGVKQSGGYTINDTLVQFSEAPPNGSKIEVIPLAKQGYVNDSGTASLLLNDLVDVTITAAQNLHVLQYLNGAWANQAVSLGWNPTFAGVSDGARRVLQVTDWFGGTGIKPATGQFIGALGFVTLIADATDFRGLQGTSGTGGSGGASSVPTLLTTNQIYTITTNTQVLYADEIDFSAGAIIDFESNSTLILVN